MRSILFWGLMWVFIWIWKRGRKRGRSEVVHRSVVDMVPCRQCGLHVPRAEAVVGRSGFFYCNLDHRSWLD